VLVAFPFEVRTETCPEAVLTGTVVVNEVIVAVFTIFRVRLKAAEFPAGDESKLFPLTVTLVPAMPMVGVNPLTEGRPVPDVTVKTPVLVTVLIPTVTVMVPLVAPDGTVVTN
jgi:hypothetical protein